MRCMDLSGLEGLMQSEVHAEGCHELSEKSGALGFLSTETAQWQSL
jgi:hypothetical protein